MIFQRCSEGIYLSTTAGAKLPTANSYTAPHLTQAPDVRPYRGLVVCKESISACLVNLARITRAHLAVQSAPRAPIATR